MGQSEAKRVSERSTTIESITRKGEEASRVGFKRNRNGEHSFWNEDIV